MSDEIYVTKPSMPSMEEYISEIKKIWNTHILTNMGEEYAKLELMLQDYLRVSHISLFSNGHMALELVMQAMKLEGEVITTPFTFASTTHAIVRNGLQPVFCDINEDDYTMDASKIENLITDRTCAIVPVHVYGHVCDVEEIERIAQKYKLKVIYDAAHTFGEKYKGKGIGNFGDASIFSFHATKVFNTIEGGAVCYQEDELGEKLYNLKNFGIQSETTISSVGANAKMNEFQAAMGICNLRHIDDEISRRKKVVERYVENLYNVDGIKISSKNKDLDSNYAYFPIEIEERKLGWSRDETYEKLKENGIYSRKYFYPLTSEFQCYKGNLQQYLTPIALKVSQQVLTLPLYADLELETVDKISKILVS